MIARRARRREGLSLLEVLISLAIFLMSLVAISRLIDMGSDQAIEIRWQSEGARLAQSTLARVHAGDVSLSAGGGGPFDEEPDWEWSVESEPAGPPNLWRVTVRVSRERSGGSRFETGVTQFLIDPAARGGLAAAAPAGTASDPAATTPTTGSSGSPTPPSGSGSTGGSGIAPQPPPSTPAPGNANSFREARQRKPK